MISSSALVAAFTAMFTVTGLYSLVRLSRQVSGAATGVDRVAELSHLLMSVAMVGMTWGWTGGPGTASGVLQLVVFGLLGAWFLARTCRPDGHGRVGSAYHLVVQVAMVWMVAAMPRLMGMGAATGSAPSTHEHAGHGGGGAGAGGMTGMAMPSATPRWMQVVTVAFAVLLAAVAVAWAARAGRRVRPTGPRLDACCHFLMSLGMAAMLLAML